LWNGQYMVRIPITYIDEWWGTPIQHNLDRYIRPS
jgi:hypothetical protein